jgi:hypothetical protein
MSELWGDKTDPNFPTNPIRAIMAIVIVAGIIALGIWGIHRACSSSTWPETTVTEEEVRAELIGNHIEAGDYIWKFEKGDKIQIEQIDQYKRFGITTIVAKIAAPKKDGDVWLTGPIFITVRDGKTTIAPGWGLKVRQAIKD